MAKMDAVELAAGDRQVALLFGTARERHRIMLCHEIVDLDVAADMDAIVERDTLGGHLLDTPIEMALFHLEVGDAVAHQPAGLVVLFVEMHIVPGAGELLRAGEPEDPSRSPQRTCRS